MEVWLASVQYIGCCGGVADQCPVYRVLWRCVYRGVSDQCPVYYKVLGRCG